MLFNSIPFIFIFLPVVAIGFYVLGAVRHPLAAAVYYVATAVYNCIKSILLVLESFWLCIASLCFYAYWDATYLWLLLTSIVLNYTAGYWIARSAKKSERLAYMFLCAAVSTNILVLAYYKYFTFIETSLNGLFGWELAIQKIILPLGISFFTFTQIAYLVDAYRGKVKEYNFVHYLLFVTYFPHLIAGPILHHAQMIPQFRREEASKVKWENFVIGISFFVIGLFKKVFIADTCAGFATPVFDAAKVGTAIPFVDAWLGAYAYTLQLYFDFSGYCDMAIGISYFFNIRLPYNFNSPYKAVNIIDFWRRWHITLSTFLRDYLYIPLGGNRSGKWRRYLNLFITMLLGGLWHGAGWTFILWGALHGVYLIINHAFHAFRKKMNWQQGMWGRWGAALSVAVTFLSVMLAWVLFRSENMLAVHTMFSSMTGGNGFALTPKLVYYCKLHLHPLLIPGMILIWALPNTQQWIGIKDTSETETGTIQSVPPWWMCIILGLVLAACIIKLLLMQLSGAASEFLYYQF